MHRAQQGPRGEVCGALCGETGEETCVRGLCRAMRAGPCGETVRSPQRAGAVPRASPHCLYTLNMCIFHLKIRKKEAETANSGFPSCSGLQGSRHVHRTGEGDLLPKPDRSGTFLWTHPRRHPQRNL